MKVSSVFKQVIEPTMERVSVIEVLHVERHEGRDFVISHTLRRNILSEFDRKLSRHLAAAKGAGFPAVSVSVKVRDKASETGWQACPGADYPSIPHALSAIARRAIGEGEQATLRLHYHGLEDERSEAAGLKRVIERSDMEILDAALESIRHFGELAFLDITGDFDLIMIKPPEATLQPIMLDLFNRRMTVPPVPGLTAEHVSVPLFDFDRVMAQNTEARTYLASLRHVLMGQKEGSILEFRSACEKRILEFDRALQGRPLEGFRLDAVMSLVSRLKAGLGAGLRGLSEDAQITAFEWASMIDAGGGHGAGGHGPAAPEREPLPFPDRTGARSARG